MPCNTIQRSKVEFLFANTDISLLEEALRSLGYSDIARQNDFLTFRTPQGGGIYNRATGKLVLPQSCEVNTIKRAYSERVVQSQASRHGWKIAWGTNAQGRRQAIVQRRG